MKPLTRNRSQRDFILRVQNNPHSTGGNGGEKHVFPHFSMKGHERVFSTYNPVKLAPQ